MFKGGMGNIMKQAQQMQEKMQRAQEENVWSRRWDAIATWF